MAKQDAFTASDLPLTRYLHCANCQGLVLNDQAEDMYEHEGLLYCSDECLDEANYDPCEHYTEECDQGAWTTEDGCNYYQHGKLLLNTSEMGAEEAQEAATAIMELQGLFPNVFYVSDHGNISLTTVT